MTIAEQLNVTEFPFIIKDSRGNPIYVESVDRFYFKQQFDLNNSVIYFENSRGLIRDNRAYSIPEYTMEELTKMLGKEFKLKK